ncbi:MAG: Rieske (2Fe-2S) protein [Acidimicrobiales bacterium]
MSSQIVEPGTGASSSNETSNEPPTITSATDDRSTTATVGRLEDIAVGEMKLARVGEHRVAVIRSASGVHALDNACPHQGYGLVTGSLDGELLTCQWHNWKFRVSDGRCLIGEEDVACHQTDVVDGDISVTITLPTKDEALNKLWPSLRSGFERDYVGQMARDTARLLQAGATAEDIVWEGLKSSAPRSEYGIGHGMAMAADCLTISDLYEADAKTLPVVQALSGLSEPTRGREAYALPVPEPAASLRDSIETEDVESAMASVLGLLDAGATRDEVLAEFLHVVGTHHIGYGHGAIYTQKTFELLDRVGWERAADLLPWLAMMLVYGTREDTLPYMKKAMRQIDDADLEAMVNAPDRTSTGWTDQDETLRQAILDSPQAAIAEAEAATIAGAGVEGLLDTVTLAVSERLLRYAPENDFDHSLDFGWLDITHGLTYAHAARWAWRNDPSPMTARLALFTVFLAHDTGRAARWGEEQLPLDLTAREGDVMTAVLEGRPADAVAFVLGADAERAGEDLVKASLDDRSGSFIVAAHIIKLSQAARGEAEAMGSSLPLAAAARYSASPRLERFVARNAVAALDFVRTGTPPKR